MEFKRSDNVSDKSRDRISYSHYDEYLSLLIQQSLHYIVMVLVTIKNPFMVVIELMFGYLILL